MEDNFNSEYNSAWGLRVHKDISEFTPAQQAMYNLSIRLYIEGYDNSLEIHPHMPNGFILKNIIDCRKCKSEDEPGNPVEGDFICGDNAYGLIEAGFGFGISEHTNDDVLGYLSVDDCLKLVKGTYWAEKGE